MAGSAGHVSFHHQLLAPPLSTRSSSRSQSHFQCSLSWLSPNSELPLTPYPTSNHPACSCAFLTGPSGEHFNSYQPVPYSEAGSKQKGVEGARLWQSCLPLGMTFAHAVCWSSRGTQDSHSLASTASFCLEPASAQGCIYCPA